MKWYISFLLVYNFFFFVGCSNSSINVDPNKVNIKEENIKVNDRKKKVVINEEVNVGKRSDNYRVAMGYRRKLWINGIDYIPWKNHLPIDVKFMPTLLKFNKKEIKLYYLDKHKIVATKGKTFFSKKNNTLFLNYKSNISSIKKFTSKNIKYTKRYKRSQYSKKTKSTKYDNKVQITLKSNTLKGSYRLQSELNKLYSSEITRYNLLNYSIIPISEGKIHKKGKNLYMPVNTLYQEMLGYFQRTRL